ncbi:hypothetical protein EJ07DRAFT_95384 [Lizonia empirigonia]|nr:hypothetical protein EJ07DRAFT_95384 [Lizonia empirigonia]
MADEVPTCANCKETATAKNVANLKACTRCKTTRYCGRDCQKANWKIHKKNCSENAAEASKSSTEHSDTYSTPRLNDLEKHVPDPFTKLDQGKYLFDRPQADVYKLLIDSFRMRQSDDVNYEFKTMPRSVYTGASSSAEPFRQYLDKAAARPALLPPWWTAEKSKECIIFGESGAWSDLRKAVTKQEVIQHYGDRHMPMQLRMLAEVVYGTSTMGHNGSDVQNLMMLMESGGLRNGGSPSMFDASR